MTFTTIELPICVTTFIPPGENQNCKSMVMKFKRSNKRDGPKIVYKGSVRVQVYITAICPCDTQYCLLIVDVE